MSNEQERYARAKDFLQEKDLAQAELKFIEFLLSFPDSKQGEDELLSYFYNNTFSFHDQVPDSEFIRAVLEVLGDMHEDGGSHSYRGIYFWRQLRNAIIECKDAKDKYAKWKSAIMKQVIAGKLTREMIENYYK